MRISDWSSDVCSSDLRSRNSRQHGHQFQATLEQPLLQRLGEAADGAGRILVEVFEVGAEVEDEELALVLPRAEKIRAQARAAPDPLQELHLRANRLEDNQVDDLRHVDTGVQDRKRRG